MPDRRKIAVVGAGNVGAACALFAAKRELGDIYLVDVTPTMPMGRSLDIIEGAALEYFDAGITGTDDMGALKEADVVIVSAGKARTPGMSRDDLAKINTAIIREVARNIKKFAPESFVIVVTNPLDVMAYVMKQETGFPRERVLGMAGVLDGARFAAFIAIEFGVSIKDVHAMVLGGHGDLMVPLVRYASVSGIPITELLDREKIEKLIERTRLAGGEIVNLLKTGSASISPASSAVVMAESYLKDQRRLVAASAYLDGEYGISDIYFGVPVVISGKGATKIIELSITGEEMKLLHASATSVRAEIEKVRGI